MRVIEQAQQWNLSVQNILLVSAIGLGVVVMGYNSESLLGGIQLVWKQAGYASLVLVPLTLLLAATLLRGLDKHVDQHALNKHYALVTALAPMAGFLGTIFGIMKAVRSLGEAENAEHLIAMVSQTFASMSVAFTTTAWGLILAMIAVFVVKMREKKNNITDQEQRFKMIYQLQDIASSLNDMRPTVRQRQLYEDTNKGEDQ